MPRLRLLEQFVVQQLGISEPLKPRMLDASVRVLRVPGAGVAAQRRLPLVILFQFGRESPTLKQSPSRPRFFVSSQEHQRSQQWASSRGPPQYLRIQLPVQSTLVVAAPVERQLPPGSSCAL